MAQRQLRWRNLLQFVHWGSHHDRTAKNSNLQGIAQSLNGRSRLTRWLVIGGVFFVSTHSALVQGTGVANAQLRPIADGTLGDERSLH